MGFYWQSQLLTDRKYKKKPASWILLATLLNQEGDSEEKGIAIHSHELSPPKKGTWEDWLNTST